MIHNVLFRYSKQKVKQILIILLKVVSFIYLPVAFLIRFFGYKIIGIKYTNAIGHISLEPDIFLRENFLKKKKFKGIIISPKHETCNLEFLKYLKKYFVVFSNPIICILMFPLKKIKFLNYNIYDYQMNDQGTVKLFKTLKLTYDNAPFHTISQKHLVHGLSVLDRWGLKKNDWFVGLHVREPNYRDYGKKNVRDTDINSFCKAIDYIENLGGYVIKLGLENNNLNIQNKKFINYSNSEFRSDEMDIFLSTQCKFFIGTNSGLHNLPLIFKTPILYFNMFPIEQINSQPNSIATIKLVRDNKTNKFLKFKDVLNLSIKNSFKIDDYNNLGLTVIDNDQDLILDVLKEYLLKRENKFHETKEDIDLQKKFHSMYKFGHYCYGTAGKISAIFLRKYKYLL